MAVRVKDSVRDGAPLLPPKPGHEDPERLDKQIQRRWRHPENSDHRTSLVLCPRPERPPRRAAEKRDHLPALHSITSSARAMRDCGTVMPRALAVRRLRTSSTLVACCTGKSA